jgi:hypothetical protein
MLTRIIFPLFLLVSFTAYGQKVKVKKGFIYLSKVKMYRIVDIKTEGLFQKHDKAILSIENGDTLIWMKKQQLVNPKAEFETEEKVLDYLDLRFKGRPEVVSMIPRPGDGLYKSLLYERVLSNQAIDTSGLYSFKFNGFPRIYAVELLRLAIEQRKRLQAIDGYAAYAKNHTLRSPNAEMVLSNGNVLFKASENSVPVSIGSVIRERNADRLANYLIYRSFDHKLIATIVEEKSPFTVSIETEFDHGTVSFVPDGLDPDDILLMSLKYLTDAGYL